MQVSMPSFTPSALANPSVACRRLPCGTQSACRKLVGKLARHRLASCSMCTKMKSRVRRLPTAQRRRRWRCASWMRRHVCLSELLPEDQARPRAYPSCLQQGSNTVVHPVLNHAAAATMPRHAEREGAVPALLNPRQAQEMMRYGFARAAPVSHTLLLTRVPCAASPRCWKRCIRMARCPMKKRARCVG